MKGGNQMHNKQRLRLRRALAGLLSAAMIFTTDSGVLLAAPFSQTSDADLAAVSEAVSEGDFTLSGGDISVGDLTVSEGDTSKENLDVSEEDANVSDTVSTGDTTSDETVSDTETDVVSADSFTLTPADIQYGEDGSNKAGNLDALFAPKYVVDGNVLTLNEDYTVTYKFFTENAPASAEAFAAAEGTRLETIPAGTVVTVCALADGTEKLATATFTVSKRKVVVRYTVSKEDALDGREVPEDGQLVIPKADILPENLTVSVAEDASADTSFAAADELSAALADAIDGDLTLDVSDVDVTEDGYQVVPMEFSLTPEFDDNYEIVGNIFGDVYVKKAKYYVTFTVNNEGEQWSATYEQDYNTEKAVNQYSFYSEMTAAVNALLAKSENTTLVGWSVYTDSHNVSPVEQNYGRSNYYRTVFLNPDASTYEYSSSTRTFNLSGTHDYHFVAQVKKAAAGELYVTTIPSVYYDGHAHVALGTKINAKKQSADLRLAVYAAGSSTPLNPGKDYTVTYANNTNASMQLVRDASGKEGSYVKTWKDNAERPKVTITGKGNYKGFSAEVYFDILPVSLGAIESSVDGIANSNSGNNDSYSYSYPYTYTYSGKAVLSGYAISYQLNAVSKIKSPKVTKEFYTYVVESSGKYATKRTAATVTLKEGTDYELEFYRFDDEEYKWVRAVDEKGQNISRASDLTLTGDYLCVVRGKGNYCGAVYDSYYDWADEDDNGFDNFDPESPNPYRDLTDSHQFKLVENSDYDFSKVKITIGKKSLPFAVDTEKNSPKSYGGDKSGFDITVKKGSETLTLGTDYEIEFRGKYRESGESSSVYESDEYTVYVYPRGNYYGYGRVAGKVKITGMKLKSSYFKLSAKTVALGASASWSITDAGKAAGLGSDYYDVDSESSYKGYWASASKVTYIIGGADSGAGIDPSSTVKLSFSRKAMSLQEAMKTPNEEQPYVKFEIVSETEGETPSYQYNVKGAIPRVRMYYLNSSGNQRSSTYTISYNGYTVSRTLYDANGNSFGRQYFTFNVKNNNKVGNTATITVTGKGVFKGSATIGNGFIVSPCKVNSISTITSLTGNYYAGDVYAMFTDAQYTKGNLDKPNVKLYQAYSNKGKIVLAPLGKNQYAVDQILKPSEENAHGCSVSFTSPSGDFEFNKSKYASAFGLYDSTKLPSVKSVTIDGKEYTVTKNHIDSKDGGYYPVFTGGSIRPYITAVTLDDDTVLNTEDYIITYSANLTAGTNTGSLTITTRYNSSQDRYPYKGKVTLKFDIAESSKITL